MVQRFQKMLEKGGSLIVLSTLLLFPLRGVAKPPAQNLLEKQLESESLEVESSDETAFVDSNFVFDLTDCVRMALKNNPEVKGANYDIEESQWRLKEAQPRGIPIVDYEYEVGPAPTDAADPINSFLSGDLTLLNRVKIGVGVPVTSFGKIRIAQSLAREGIDAAKEKKNLKSSEVVLKVKQLYYGLLLARDLKNMLRDANRQLEPEILKQEQSKKAKPIDVAKLKLTRFELLKREGEAARKEQLALEGLRIQMGIVRSVPFEVKDAHLRPIQFELKDFQFYLDESKRYRPESRLLDIGLKAKEDEYRLEKRKLTPNVGFGVFFEMGSTLSPIQNVGVTSTFNDPFNFKRAGFGVRVKGQLNFKEARAKIKQKEAQYFKMSLLKDHAEEGLDLDLKDAYLNAKQSKVDLESAEEAQKIARQLIFMLKNSQDFGVGDKRDFADALQAYLLTKGRYYEAVFYYNVAVATLMSKVGYVSEP